MDPSNTTRDRQPATLTPPQLRGGGACILINRSFLDLIETTNLPVCLRWTSILTYFVHLSTAAASCDTAHSIL